MTLHQKDSEVGVRELHDRLSEYLERVEKGGEVVVTRRGRRIARLSALEADGPLEELARRGLVRLPQKPRSPRQARVKGTGSVSDLVAEQRR
ncbi:MAG: type II toxin-antitoxin system prevent-host-death family antitoxin [Solirubrobacterales bacterium]|nr:type II toxin-antitoxin system prevent-host-death family antitoxin [Solirubrobacterales bacterium]